MSTKHTKWVKQAFRRKAEARKKHESIQHARDDSAKFIPFAVDFVTFVFFVDNWVF
jgi:hypothetical protein